MESESNKLESIEPTAEKFQPIIDLYSQGKIKQALNLIKVMQQEFPNSAFLYDFAGACNSELENFVEAINCYKQAIKIRPNFSDAFNNMGNVLVKVGKFDEAIKSYNQAVLIEPNYSTAHLNLANTKLNMFDYEGAKDAFKLAIKYDSENHLAYYLLANIEREEGAIEKAIEYYKEAININPEFADAYNNLGSAIIAKGDFEEAIDILKKALLISSNFSNAHNNLGIALKNIGSLYEAIESFKMAIKIEPLNPQALYNLGDTFLEKGDLDFAIDSYKKAIVINPDFNDAYLNLGNAYRDKGSSDLALGCYKDALEIKKDFAVAEFNQALTYLDKEEFKKGWVKYERRWDSVSYELDSQYSSVQKWRPGDNGRVLLWQEQGVGDVIMFSSLISELYSKCDKLIIQVDQRLIPIFSRSFHDDIVYYKSEDNISQAEYDFQIPMGSLPQYFRNDLISFKNCTGQYLKSDEKRSLKLKKLIQKSNNDCIVGISWKGGSKIHSASRNRSMELSQIISIFTNARVNLVNLQYGYTEQERKMLESQNGIYLKNISEIDNFNDLDGLSALIDACDYIVSVDNLTVHLSGSLGKKTFALLPFSPDWRWGLSRDTSLWYPSVNLIRQSRIANWSDPLSEIKHKLKNIL